MDAIKIPQNVYIEDRIIGPITLRQIILCCIGGGISYAIWASIQSAYGYATIPLTLLAWSPAGVFAAFAFVKIENLSLLQISFLLLERLSKPTIRIWGARQGITIIIKTRKSTNKEQQRKEHQTKKNIEELSSFLDRSYNDEIKKINPNSIHIEPPIFSQKSSL